MARRQTPKHPGRRVEAAPPPDRILRLDFAGIDRPVLLVEAEAFLPDVFAATRGWPVTVTALAPDDLPGTALSTVLGDARGRYTQLSVYLEKPLVGLGRAAAVCGLIADLAQARLKDRPDWLALHCGAFVSGGAVVAVTGPARAGKSTLMARLSAETDFGMICDDVLPIDPAGMAMALGVGPRLRLPLPPRADARFRAHVARTTTLADRHYAYLRPATLWPHGPAGRLGAVVLLDRRDDGPAALHRVDPAEAVRHLLMRNMTVADSIEARFDRIARLVQEAVCLRLVYADLALIRSAVPPGVSWPALRPRPALPQEKPEQREISTTGGRRFRAPDQVLEATPNVAARRVGGDLFLCLPDRQDIVHLNALGGAVWRCLARPASGAHIAALLARAFPDTEPATIAADVSDILADLGDAGLVVATEKPPTAA